MARAAAFIQNQNHLLDSAKTFAYFNKQFGDIDAISEAEAQPEFRFTPPETPIDPKVRTNLIGKELKPLKLGLSRDELKAAALIETSYQTGAEEKWHAQRMQRALAADKHTMSTFGYKHAKSHRLFAYLLKCLRCCYEGKFDQLNVDLNFFLLLKNELSLHFLRQEQNTL